MKIKFVSIGKHSNFIYEREKKVEQSWKPSNKLFDDWNALEGASISSSCVCVIVAKENAPSINNNKFYRRKAMDFRWRNVMLIFMH